MAIRALHMVSMAWSCRLRCGLGTANAGGERCKDMRYCHLLGARLRWWGWHLCGVVGACWRQLSLRSRDSLNRGAVGIDQGRRVVGRCGVAGRRRVAERRGVAGRRGVVG